MLKLIGIVVAILLVVIGGLLIVAATKPSSFQVQRSATINAPPEKIFAFLNDFHRWPTWSPWERMDPDMKRMHSGAESGPGAIYAWEGNKQVGQGRMEIAAASAPTSLRIDLHFLKPFQADNVAEFTLQPQGGSTTVNWTMRGASPFLFRLMGIFMDLDAMIGKDFEAGLANLKTAAEQ